jgi:hypothetical protein
MTRYDPGDPQQQAMLRRLAEGAHAAGNASVAANPSDPAFWMLLDGHASTPVVYLEGCYICEDPEFAAMGMPLCRPCPECVRERLVVCTTCNGAHTTDGKTPCPTCQGRGYAGSLGHVPADDVTCDECGGEDGPHQYTGDPEWLIAGIPREKALFVKNLRHQ